MKGKAWRIVEGGVVLATAYSAGQLAKVIPYCTEKSYWERLTFTDKWVFHMTMRDFRELVWTIRVLWDPRITNGHLDLRYYPHVYSQQSYWKDKRMRKHIAWDYYKKEKNDAEMVEHHSRIRMERNTKKLKPDADGSDPNGGKKRRGPYQGPRKRSRKAR